MREGWPSGTAVPRTFGKASPASVVRDRERFEYVLLHSPAGRSEAPIEAVRRHSLLNDWNPYRQKKPRDEFRFLPSGVAKAKRMGQYRFVIPEHLRGRRHEGFEALRLRRTAILNASPSPAR